MQKKSENAAHAQDGIKLSKLKNSGPLVEFATDKLNSTWKLSGLKVAVRPRMLPAFASELYPFLQSI